MRFRRVLTAAALGFAAPLSLGAAQAQTSDDNRDADALAADMRLLAANPNDIEALVVAGELTLRLGDPTAAAGFFTRAEKLDPNNARIKAGWGSILVRAERPGEALRRFQEAEARGLAPVRFAADRGLAYDLVGQQERAQRDYRLVLRDHADDEVTRRYALSLAISGNKDEALRQLDPLIKRSDRAAWRARAFVLAMDGDATGADRIATTMMAPGLGQALAPFFRRLPQLRPADRAFAVTFGELSPSPLRIADAQMVPPLPALGPDPYAPRVAVAAPVRVVAADDGRRRRKGRRETAAPAATPTPTPAPTQVAMAPPAYTTTPPARTIVATPIPAPVPAPVSAPAPPPVRVVAASPVAIAAAGRSAAVAARVAIAADPGLLHPPIAPVTAPVVIAAAPPAAPTPPLPGVADRPSAAEAGVPAGGSPTAAVSEDAVLARIATNAGAVPAPTPAPVPAPVVVASPVVAPPPPASTGALAAGTPSRPATAARRATRDDDASTARRTAGRHEVAEAKAASAPVGAKPDRAGPRGRVAEAEPPVALDKNGCPLPPAKGKATNRQRATSTRIKPASAARCKALAAEAAEAKKADAAARAEPSRTWVQVAGGADEASLENAWKIMRDRAPALLRGRQGWTTPLRATNRVLTGPFKDSDEAQAFVNKLIKAGVPAFVFTSAKGQKIERLGGK